MADNMKDKNIAILESIVKILKDNNLSEIEYETDNIKIEVVAMQQVVSNVPVTSNNNVLNTAQLNSNTSNNTSNTNNNEKQDLSKHKGAVISPMVGTCYLAPEPGAKKFIEIGDEIKKGQPLLIIEAMKVMNYIRAKNDGKVIDILVKDSQPVEYGQLLLVIE